MNCRKGKSRTYLSDADREALALPPRRVLAPVTMCAVAPAPNHTKPAKELQRGDVIRDGGRWSSVVSAEQNEDGQIRVVLAGPRLLGWFPPDQAVPVSPETAEAWEPRRRVLRGVDLIEKVLGDYVQGEGHHGPRAHAANLVGGIAGLEVAELEEAIDVSLRAKGVFSKDAVARCRTAWLLAASGG